VSAGTGTAGAPLVESREGAERRLAVSNSANRTEHDVIHALPGRVRCRVPRVRGSAAYARRLEALAEANPGVQSLRVNRRAASVVVEWTGALEPATATTQLVALLAAGEQPGGDAVPVSHARPDPFRSRLPRLLFPALMAGVAGLGRVVGLTFPAPLGALAIFAASMPIARRAYHALRVEHRLNIDVLDMTAIVLTTLRGSYMAPAAMIGLVEVGEAIRERTARASQRELLDLLDSIAHVAWVERDGERQQLLTDDLRRGDVVVVYPGDRIPADGRVLEGSALVDEHQLTGEPMPVMREEGQVAYASTLVREGHLHMAVEQLGRETRAGRIVQLMREAPVHDTRIEDYAGKVADRIVLPALLLAGAVFAATRDPARAASILITDFATGIRVSVPTTVLATMTGAAQRGVLIRSGRALEQLAGIDAVVFDKTGTITEGQPTVTRVESVRDDVTPGEVLTLAATVEQRLNHPVAEAVMRYAAARGVRPGRRDSWHYDIGLGVRAQIEGRAVLVGSDRLLAREAVSLDRVGGHVPQGESQVYVALDGDLLGYMSYGDPVRNEAARVIAELRDTFGMEIHLLTGDRAQTARAVGGDLGIPEGNVHGELFPEEKAAVVRALRRRDKRVAFVGDGINDLPALAYADVSISFGSATDVARETADVVLMEDDLRGLPIAFATARQALTLIRQNIAIVGGVNLAAMAVTTAAGLRPVTAAFLHNGSTVVAALNGLRPLRDAGRPRTRLEPLTPESGEARIHR
jgi:Cu2+-exporting ATPase